MATHNEYGKQGEDVAVSHLVGLGHEILQRNWRYKRAEVDIISRIGDTIVFTEVKARKNNRYGYPEEAVSDLKREKMAEAMEQYLSENNCALDPRFDIISITGYGADQELYHIEDAFYH